MNVNRSMKGIY